ncbi:DUF262 domain-containing protein [Luteimonas fraxinea]|uniref:DUF262 domain-containing protein n=1 Tax=Luteimonas fraxinea TaxID=2901869 RepID=UPI001E3D5CF6|nr:DUF262 domain-containing protein [Luteimonas fraxinea]MCD9126878.1 DUF262 domain-containing protein [Luteimonas fraxinea]
MQTRSADPDLRTLVKRIEDNELDLQPEFQRGEVWSETKQQRLIDSILRDWQIPPVHIVIDPETDRQFVLDGQQRLVAIREFVAGRLSINGSIEPHDKKIQALNGAGYETLPEDIRRRFDRYSIRVFYIYDYSPEEPGELFFRLNQNSALTPAEQRNAFFGGARRQVKRIIEDLESEDLKSYYFGFSNARMAYDDIVARALLILEAGTLRQKVTSALLVEKYRSSEGFSQESVDWLMGGVRLLAGAKRDLYTQIRLNKATGLSWLIFASRLARYSSVSNLEFSDFICSFEIRRHRALRPDNLSLAMANPGWSDEALAIYSDRSSARVGDVSSVVLRDFVIWLHFLERNNFQVAVGTHLSDSQLAMLREVLGVELDIQKIAEALEWGETL